MALSSHQRLSSGNGFISALKLNLRVRFSEAINWVLDTLRSEDAEILHSTSEFAQPGFPQEE
jgi:hypothetical protein